MKCTKHDCEMPRGYCFEKYYRKDIEKLDRQRIKKSKKKKNKLKSKVNVK